MTAPKLSLLPEPDVPEIALAGRSNVGKSSLLNALTGRSGLARTSNTPGRTQALNLFDVGRPPRLRLVDMPGYGYAEAPRDIVKRWTALVFDYLRGRPGLARVLLLVDSRHGLKPVDREVLALLGKAAVSTQIVLTKADKPKATELARVRDSLVAECRSMAHVHPETLVTSSAKGSGIAELRLAVLAAAEPALAEAMPSRAEAGVGEGGEAPHRREGHP